MNIDDKENYLIDQFCIFHYDDFEKNIVIDEHTRILLFIYGIIILITADWNLFFHEAKWFKYVQRIIGDSQ